MTVSIRHPMTMPRLAGRAVAVSLGALVAATSFNALAAAPAHAGTAEPAQSDTAGWTVTAPSEGSGLSAAGPSGPRAVLHHDRAAGTVTLAVERAGRAVLQPAPVGIVTEQVDLSTGLRALGRRDRVVVERYDTTVGKRRQRTAIFQEARFSFAGAGGSRLDLIVRVARDGVAYRYALPDNRGAVLREASAFTLPAASPAWLAPFSVYYENPFAQTTSDGAAAGEYMHPALFETPGGYALLTESDVDGRYSGARLTHDAGSNTYRVKLADDKVLVDGPLTTPWRTAIVGDLDTVAASTLVDDLAPRSKVGDTGWIQPGKAFWSWLAGGRDAGQSLKIQKGYVDFAAAHGWPYVVVDAGWNRDPNWDPDPTWEQTSWLPELVRYGRARNVKIMTWIHFEDLDTAEERARRLPLFEKWGIVGLKIDFMDSDAQERYRWYDQILPETAAYHLMINFHGSTIPHGIHRTWPHVVTMEGVWGAEHSRDLASTHLTALPFTRDVVGSMDYTPMAWHRPNRPTSDAHELALSVVFESGLQNFAGRIDGYDARPEAERFLDQVPTVWDDTRLLAGRPADSAVFARRSGDRWFIGGGFAGAARTAQVPLALPAGRWLVDLVRDGATGLVREPRVATAGDTLAVDVVANGGFAAIACRWHPGITTCDKPVSRVPATTVTLAPAQTDATPGSSFTVSGQFTVDDRRTVTGVTLAPRVPAGWTVQGRPVRAERLRPGQALKGTWTITAPAASPTFGYLDVPVVARFRAERRAWEDEQTTQVHSWKPLESGWAYLSDRAFVTETNGLGAVERDTTNGGAAAGDGRGIAFLRATYGKGLGMFAPGEVTFALDGRCTQFTADVGVDDEARLDVARTRLGGTVGFVVAGDGATLTDTGVLTVRSPVRTVTADVTGVKTLTLRVTDGGDGTQNDRASWADARVRCSS